MNKETLEHISSLMDGETSRETGLFLTSRLCADEQLTRTWERYHLIRDCIRQPAASITVADFSQRMRVALQNEGAVDNPAATGNRWLKAASGLAIAASVAFLAILAVDPVVQPAGVEADAGVAAQPFSSPNVLPTRTPSQAASFSGQASDARLNSYLLRHNQLAGSAGARGFVSFVPIISSSQAEADEEKATEEPDKNPVIEP